MDIDGVDENSRDYDIQQIKTKVYTEFEQRLKKVFPEGFRIDTFEFGVDKGWYQELKEVEKAV